MQIITCFGVFLPGVFIIVVRLVIIALAVCIGIVTALELQRRAQAQLYLVLEHEPLDQADTLLEDKAWQQARLLAQFVKDNPRLGDTHRAQAIETAADSAIDSLPSQLRDFLNGAISGEPENTASFIGSLALDLFVIGDIRDILVQGYKQATKQNGDTVVLALSATGLGLALLPELHWAPAMLKGLKRTGSLSKPFLKSLRRLSGKALKTGNFKPLARLVGDFGRATQKLGLGPMKGSMKAIDNELALAKFSRATAKNPRQAYAVAKLGGPRGIKQLSKNGENVATIARKLKRTSRFAKALKKGFRLVPTWALIVLLILDLALILRLTLARAKH